MELWREFAVGYERRRYESDRDVSVAWHAASLVWQKKLPPLKSLLSQRKTAARSDSQSVEQQKVTLHLLSEYYGYPMRHGGSR